MANIPPSVVTSDTPGSTSPGFEGMFASVWRPEIERVEYPADSNWNSGFRHVKVRVRLTNTSNRTQSVAKDQFRPVLVSPLGNAAVADFQLTSGSSPQSGPFASAPAGGTVTAEFLYRVTNPAAVPVLQSLTIYRRERQGIQWRDSANVVTLPLTGPHAPPAATSPTPTPAPSPANPAPQEPTEEPKRTNAPREPVPNSRPPANQTTPGQPIVNPFNGAWSTEIERVVYGPSPDGRPSANIRVKFTNRSIMAQTLMTNQMRVALNWINSATVGSPANFELTSGQTGRSGPVISAEPNGTVTVDFLIALGTDLQETATHNVKELTLFRREMQGTRWVDTANVIRLPLTGPHAPPAPPVVTPPPPPPAPPPLSSDQAAMLKSYEGRYSTSWGTNVTFTVVGNELHGSGITTTRPTPLESIKMTMNADGSLTGKLRESIYPRADMWYDLTLRFNADASAFMGHAIPSHNTSNDPGRAYTGQRIRATPGTGTSGGPTPPPSQGTGGFTNTAYMDVKVDRVGRTPEGWVEINMTVRNTEDEQKSAWNDPQTYHLVGDDGMEYRWNGNYYGASASQRLTNTVWIYKDALSRSTRVYDTVPANVRPVRLILRNGGQETARFELQN